jgi:hypothetical protein
MSCSWTEIQWQTKIFTHTTFSKAANHFLQIPLYDLINFSKIDLQGRVVGLPKRLHSPTTMEQLHPMQHGKKGS